VLLPFLVVYCTAHTCADDRPLSAVTKALFAALVVGGVVAVNKSGCYSVFVAFAWYYVAFRVRGIST
jgi:hypothetical protein